MEKVPRVWITGAGTTEFEGRDLGPHDNNVKHKAGNLGFPCIQAVRLWTNHSPFLSLSFATC